jgi:hypothetical protein
LLSEIVPISQGLATVAAAGLQALDCLIGDPPPAGWRAQQLELLKQAEQPQAEMLNMIAPSVQKLVEATTPEAPAAPAPAETKPPS